MSVASGYLLPKQIDLTQGYVALVDAEDYSRVVDAGPWHAAVSRRRDGSVRYVWARHSAYRTDGKQSTEALHRFLFNLAFGDGSIVDHISGDTLDNRQANLRLATSTGNARNHRRFANNTTGHIGVYWYKPSRKWLAQVCVNGKNLHLGLYDTSLDAALARDAAAKRYHGEFAKLNFEPEVR